MKVRRAPVSCLSAMPGHGPGFQTTADHFDHRPTLVKTSKSSWARQSSIVGKVMT
jgi:hypothetical protein